MQRLKRDSESARTAATAAGIATEPARESTRWWAIAGGVILVIGLAASGWLFFSRKAHALTDKDTIVLADFTNKTGDPVFDGTLRQGLSVQLEQSPFLSIISDQQIQQTLTMMEQKPDAKLTPEIARELCQRTGSTAVLDGSIAQIGTPYLLTVKAINCSNGETLASTETQASDKNHVLDALGKTASEMRGKLGESLSTVQRFDTPLEQATTPSLEALKTFDSAIKAHAAVGDEAAIPLYKHAIELDPNFALAYSWLQIAYTDIGEPTIAAGYAQKAYDLRDHASDIQPIPLDWLVSGFCTWRSVPSRASRQRSCRRVSENSRPSRYRIELTHRRSCHSPTRQSLRYARRHRQSQSRLPGFPHPLERCRPRHPHPEAIQGRVREV